MRLLVAVTVLLYGAVAVNSKSHHKLTYPQFVIGKTLVYDVAINTTAEIPGMHSQVAKTSFSADLKIYAESKKELILSMHNISVSGSQTSVGSATDAIFLSPSKKLENHLMLPIKCTYEGGEVKSFTLDNNESLESRKIKRTILRNLQVYIDQKAFYSQNNLPITYNVTKNSPLGNYSTHYVITSSPYEAFPLEINVFNVSRMDNYEGIPYTAYKTHHNFENQGCSGVFRKNQTEKGYSAGCSDGHEPFQTPLKRSFVQHHNLKVVHNKLVIDTVGTKETHVADLYDQNMAVTISSELRFKEETSEKMMKPSNQTEYTNLGDFLVEVNEKEISALCGHSNSSEAIAMVKSLLQDLAETVVKANLENNSSGLVGERLVRLRETLTVLKLKDLRKIEESVVSFDKLKDAEEVDIIKRQIWLDVLPSVGSSESVSFITTIIQENIDKKNKTISLWESASILAALPDNILNVTGQTIFDLSRLLEHKSYHKAPGFSVFYSTAYISVARAIYKACSIKRGKPEGTEMKKMPSAIEELNLIQERISKSGKEANVITSKCPTVEANRFIQDVIKKCKTTHDKSKRVIYIEALAHTGLPKVLPHLAPFIQGKISRMSPSYIDFLKVVAIKSLHNIVDLYPRDVENLVFPVFFNRAECSKVRIAAFSVLIRTNPSLGLLQEIAEQTWTERSAEVGSYVSSALESYANASMPCLQLIAHRIKKVLSQAKQFNIGYQHSKSFLWNIFDENGENGFTKYFQFAASNESIIPSTIYGAFEYNVGNFRDYLYKFSANIQGLTTNNALDALLKNLGMKSAEAIPKLKEQEIFTKVNIVPRDPEFWRISLYQKLFYSVHFNYFDGTDERVKDIVNIANDVLQHYLKRDSKGNVRGHLVKLYLPSSYRTEAIGQALPNPIKFGMDNPLLLSLKFNSTREKVKSSRKFELYIEPSVYVSTIHTNQILNLNDCKNVGVYHQRTISATYPFQMTIGSDSTGKFNYSYRFPQLPKKIFTYHSEAGTYTSEDKTILPELDNKSPILTIPSPFKRVKKYHKEIIPPFEVEIITEEIPREDQKLSDFNVMHLMRKYFNAGWRRRSFTITAIPEKDQWSGDTQVTFKMNHRRTYLTLKPGPNTTTENLLRESNLTKYFFDDGDLNTIAENSRLMTENTDDPHMEDTLDLTIVQTDNKRIVFSTNLMIHYTSRFGGLQHNLNAWILAKKYNMADPLVNATAEFIFRMFEVANALNYNDGSYGEQKLLVLGSMSFGKGGVFAYNPSFIGICRFIPLNETIDSELVSHVNFDYFLPEHHRECLRDIHAGKSLSVPCIKSMREGAVFNIYHGVLTWNKKSGEHIVDYYNVTYVDRFTNEPVFSAEDTYNHPFFKFRAGLIQPVSSIHNLYETYFQKVTNNAYPPTCALMDKYISTFDMETYPFPNDVPSCTFILSAHCMDSKKFAIFARISGRYNGSKEIYIYLGNDTILLTPRNKDGVYKVNFNNKNFTISAQTPAILRQEASIFAYLIDESKGILEVDAGKTGITVLYNGRNLLLKVCPRYKGELCGLCGEFNGETLKEFRGVDRCLYSNSGDFSKSSIVGKCMDKTPKYPYICEGGASSSTGGSEERMQKENETRTETEEFVSSRRIISRNMVLKRDDKFCFSLNPLPKCEDDQPPKETELKDVDFVCFLKSNPESREWLREIKTRILRELENKSCEFKETVEVAKTC